MTREHFSATHLANKTHKHSKESNIRSDFYVYEMLPVFTDFNTVETAKMGRRGAEHVSYVKMLERAGIKSAKEDRKRLQRRRGMM